DGISSPTVPVVQLKVPARGASLKALHDGAGPTPACLGGSAGNACENGQHRGEQKDCPEAPEHLQRQISRCSLWPMLECASRAVMTSAAPRWPSSRVH